VAQGKTSLNKAVEQIIGKPVRAKKPKAEPAPDYDDGLSEAEIAQAQATDADNDWQAECRHCEAQQPLADVASPAAHGHNPPFAVSSKIKSQSAGERPVSGDELALHFGSTRPSAVADGRRLSGSHWPHCAAGDRGESHWRRRASRVCGCRPLKRPDPHVF
jgi:hypothetical protein